MKTPSTAVILFSLLGLSNFSLAVGKGQEHQPTIQAREISKKLFETALVRSAVLPRRKGLQYVSSRSVTVDERSLVEVEVLVEPEANIAIPLEFGLNESSRLADQMAEIQLEEIAKALAGAAPTDNFLIEGHTCVKGALDHNFRLSIARANFIVSRLEAMGVKATLTPIGCGPAEAAKAGIDASATETILAQFRKVVIFKVAK